MKTEQLEIGFNGNNKTGRADMSPRRRRTARWWFSQMRQVVDAVTGVSSGNTPPPVQIYLSLPR
jgi:hypothetical protein